MEDVVEDGCSGDLIRAGHRLFQQGQKAWEDAKRGDARNNQHAVVSFPHRQGERTAKVQIVACGRDEGMSIRPLLLEHRKEGGVKRRDSGR